jgi:dTDP-D-glucose 4,6-dehydratase
MKILITGSAGFIGFHAAKVLCETDNEVIGIDNLNDYYDVALKQARLNQLEQLSNFHFIKSNIANHDEIQKIFETQKFDYVIHLAAQAGVRFSLENPHAYITSNLTGFLNILEACRNHPIKHLVFASSSSVYGLNETSLLLRIKMLIIPYLFMEQQKNQMKSWLIATVIYTTFQLQDFGTSRCMALGEDLICRLLSSQNLLWKTNPLMFLTMAITAETSLILMTLSKEL